MELPPNYLSDLQVYFSDHPEELALYAGVFPALEAAFPEARVKVQKSQISFYGKHLFAMVSIPVRRKKGWPEHCLLLSFGLGRRESHPRVAVAVEPYPGRWTHHVVLAHPEELDEQLLAWLREAWDFSQAK